MPPLSPEVAQLLGMLEKLTGNNLSSVWIDKNSKSEIYGCKVYHEDPLEALRIMEQIYAKIKENHPS